MSLLRAVALLGWFVIAMTWGLLESLVRWGDPSNGHRLGQILSRGALRLLGVRLQIEGSASLNVQPCVYVANHQSNADLFVLGAIYPPRTVVVGKKELLAIPFFGLWFAAAGNILLDRQHREKAWQSMATAAARVRETGVSVWVFPEGHRNPRGPMLPFRKGAFHLACMAGVPVVPVMVENYEHVLALGGLRLPGGTIQVRILDPIESTGHTPSSLQAAVRESMEAVITPR